MSKFAGEFGDRIIEELESRIKDGSFGVILKDAPQGVRTVETSVQSERNRSRAEEDDNKKGQRARGRGRSAKGRSSRDKRKAAEEESNIKPERIAAGVTYLGEGSLRELTSAAKERGIDVLLLFQVKVSQNRRTNLVTNSTKVAVIDAHSRTRFHQSRELNNIKVQRARKEKQDDGIDKEVDKLFAVVDENLVMTPLPEDYSNQQVLDRLRGVLKESHDDPLPVLTEIRFWNRQELLIDDHMLSAYRRLIGDEPATLLASGNEEERKQVLAKLLPAE